ncbi:unnamed protein product [Orchesella dallaii]|uniref:Gustatory receptor n=1 Tax=Orchesella dallaii TaxID=48710 RepID=A0ABP1QLC3_9HEXA
MPSTILSKCLQRQDHSVVDVEVENSETYQQNEIFCSNPCTVATIESSASELNNAADEIISVPDTITRKECLEMWLNFNYFSGISAFRIDSNRNSRSSWVNKVSSILFTLLAMTYTIFNVRRLGWDLEENGPPLTQQEKSSIYIALIYQLCLLLLHACVFRMMWFKRREFMSFFEFLDASKILNNVKLMHTQIQAISLFISTLLISFICTMGGLNVVDNLKYWSFFGILEYQEGIFLLGLKKSYDPGPESNQSIERSETTEDALINSGIFLSDGITETVLFGSTGMAMNFFQLLIIMFSIDYLLLSTINLWMATKSLEEYLSQWKDCRKGKDSDESSGTQSHNIANDIVKKYKELSILSRHINAITDSILPALVFMNIITMSYFMHTCVLRDWNFAVFLILKLSKAGKYYSWFISEDVQQFLEFDSQQMGRTVAEIKDSPIGIGTGVFYIDIRFFLSECTGNPVPGSKGKKIDNIGVRTRGKSSNR